MNYYYLISGLPEINPQMDASTVDFDELFDTIRRNLSKQDSYLLQYLIYPNDLTNLLAVISYEYKGWSAVDFQKPSIFFKEEIKLYKRNRRSFPDFMNDFLSESEDRLANMSLREIEDTMLDRFYHEVFELNNDFLTKYYTFFRELKSIIAAFNVNSYDFLSSPNINDAERLILQIGPDRSPSSSIIKDYPYLEEVTTVLSENKAEKMERQIDQVIWDYLDVISNEPFSREVIFAYTIRLKILKRWLTINPKNNEKDYKNMLDKMINKNLSNKMSVL